VEELQLQKFCHNLVVGAKTYEEAELMYFIESIFKAKAFNHNWGPNMTRLKKGGMPKAAAALQALIKASTAQNTSTQQQ
jgi:hypothetical protein